MRPEEIAALGDLASDAAAGAAKQIHEVHTGIARRVWRRVGPASLPVRLVHDRIAQRAYSAAAELTGTVVRAGAQAASAARPADAPSMQRSPAGRAVVSALNGAFGDTLERRGNALALTMTFRRRGRDLELTPESLASHVLYGMGARWVESVMVDGIWRLWARRPLSVMPEQVASDARHAAAALWAVAKGPAAG